MSQEPIDPEPLSKMLKTGQKVGADADFYTALADDEQLFQQVVEFVRNARQQDSTSTPQKKRRAKKAPRSTGTLFYGLPLGEP